MIYKTSNVDEIIASTTVDGVDNEQLMMVIDEFGKQPNPDKSAVTTHYQLHQRFPDLTKPISESILNLCNEWVHAHVSRQDDYLHGYVPSSFEIQKMWGVTIPVGEGMGRHDHWPDTFAFTYYLEVNDPLYFDELDYYTNPKENELYLWRGHLSHGTPSVTEIDRYTIAGTVNFVMPDIVKNIPKDFNDHGGSIFMANELLNPKVII